ncbi:MAG: hypothetical protein ACMUHM_00745 [Thermoplasmatota archaeon]
MNLRPESKLVLALAVWTSICLVFVESLEVFFVLILLGILVLRELTDAYTSKPLKDRVNFFIYTFLFIFTFIVIRKVYFILQGA